MSESYEKSGLRFSYAALTQALSFLSATGRDTFHLQTLERALLALVLLQRRWLPHVPDH